jgi:hypothetical protein
LRSRRLLLLALAFGLFAFTACGDDGGTVLTTTTTRATTTTAPSSTTTAPGVTTTVPKPEDDRVDGLALAGGFNAGSTPVTVPPDSATTTGYSDYVTITDDSGILKVDVPVEWDDVNGAPWMNNTFGLDPGTEGIGLALSATPDFAGWSETWNVPGLFFGATDQLTGSIDDVLDAFSGLSSECTYDARYPYDDGAYTGSYDWWTDCGGVGTVYVIIAARPAGEEFTAIVEITMVSEADLEVADKIVGSYYVVDPTGGTTGGGALDPNLEPNYGSGELASGFTPDPQGLEVQAGGTIDVASYLGSECTGFVTEAPDFQLTWTGSGTTPLRFYFIAAEAGGDTVLVINDPNGEWWCGDDSFEGVNPTIDFATAPAGVYDIWVGTYTADALIAGTFFVTEVDANHP